VPSGVPSGVKGHGGTRCPPARIPPSSRVVLLRTPHRSLVRVRALAWLALAAGAPAGCDRAAPEAGLAQVPPVPADLGPYDERVVQRIRETVAALEQDLGSASAWGRLGMVYEVERMRALALSCYREAEARAPEEPRWSYRSAICHWRQGELDEASVAIARALELAPDYAPAHYRRGTFALETGDLDAALSAFERAIELEPDYFGGWLGKARALLASDRAEEALAILERLRALDELDRSVASVRAAALRELGRAQEAPPPGAALTEEEVGPHWKDPWEDEVRELRRVPEELVVGGMVARGQGEEAVPILERLRDEKPDDARTLMQLAEAYAQAKRPTEARRTFRKVIELEPANVAARVGLARIWFESGGRAIAMQFLDEALSLEPDYGPALFEKARLLYFGDQHEAAIPVLERALRGDQRNPELWNWLAWSQLLTGSPEEAEASFQALLERSPERGEAWLGIAKARLSLLRLDEAEEALARAEALGIETPGLLRDLQKDLERVRNRVEREQKADGE
jgi:tetratricopeptide (TPR) repeat protein